MPKPAEPQRGRRHPMPRADVAATATEGRRVVVLLSELAVEGIARPLAIGRVVEGPAERFASLHEAHVRDASEADVATAGEHLVRLDPEPETEPVPPPAEAPASPAKPQPRARRARAQRS